MLACVSQLAALARFLTLVPGLSVGGIGMAGSMAPATAAAMRSVPVAKAGVGAAVLSPMRQVGSSLGIAVMGAIVASSMSSSQCGGRPAEVAYLNGLDAAPKVGALLTLSGAAVAAVTMRRAPQRSDEPIAEDAATAAG